MSSLQSESPLWPFKQQLVTAARAYRRLQEEANEEMVSEAPDSIFLVAMTWYERMQVYLLARFEKETD